MQLIKHYKRLEKVVTQNPEYTDQENSYQKLNLRTTLYPILYWSDNIIKLNTNKKKVYLSPLQIQENFILNKKIINNTNCDIFEIKDVKKNKKFFAKKYFNFQEYVAEKNIIYKLLEINEIQLNNTYIQENYQTNPLFLLESDDKNLIHFYSAPMFTFQDLYNMTFQENNPFQITDKQLVLIFKGLLDQIIHLGDYQLYHGNILPQNIGFYQQQEGELQIKLINFENAVYFGQEQSNNQSNISSTIDSSLSQIDNNQYSIYQQIQYPKTYSKFYACKCIRQDKKFDSNQVFSQKEEAQLYMKAEIFQAARSIWKLICGINTAHFRDYSSIKQNLSLQQYKSKYPKTLLILKQIFTENDIQDFEISDLKEYILSFFENETLNDLLETVGGNNKQIQQFFSSQKKQITCEEYLYFFKTFKLYENYQLFLEQTQKQNSNFFQDYQQNLSKKYPKILQDEAIIKKKLGYPSEVTSGLLYEQLSLISSILLRAKLEDNKEIKLQLFNQIYDFFTMDKDIRKQQKEKNMQNIQGNIQIKIDIQIETYYYEFGKYLLQQNDLEQAMQFFLMSFKKNLKKYGFQHPLTQQNVDKIGQINNKVSQQMESQNIILPDLLNKQNLYGKNSNTLIQSYINLGNYWYQKGFGQSSQEMQENALESFEVALDIINQKPTHKFEMFQMIKHIFNLLSVQQNYKDLNTYVEEIDQTIIYHFGEYTKEHNNYLLKKIEINILQYKYEEAIKFIKELQNNNKNNSYLQALCKLKEGLILSEKGQDIGDFNNAIKIFQKSLAIAIENKFIQIQKEIYVFLAELYNNKKIIKLFNQSKALEYYNISLQITTNYQQQADRYYDIGLIYFQQDNFQEAQQKFKQASDLYFQCFEEKHWKFQEVFDLQAETLLMLQLYQPALKKADLSLQYKIQNHGKNSIQVVLQYINIVKLQIKYIETGNTHNFEALNQLSQQQNQQQQQTQFNANDSTFKRKNSANNYLSNNMTAFKQNVYKVLKQANNDLGNAWGLLFFANNVQKDEKKEISDQIMSLRAQLEKMEEQFICSPQQQNNRKCVNDLLLQQTDIEVLPVSLNSSVSKSRTRSNVFQNDNNTSCIIF